MAQESLVEHPALGPSTFLDRDTDGPKMQIGGSTPGALDPTQTERLCRHARSRLSFAFFDPHTASSVPDLHHLNLNQELYRPKRVVIETLPTGQSFWRFVPNARRDEGVADEGTWPRVVEISGRIYECSQDQWDIHKLDPLYDCHVRAYPHLTVISRVPNQSKPENNVSAGHKRLSPSPSIDASSCPSSPRKKPHIHVVSESSSEGEVEGMVVDTMPTLPKPKLPGLSKRVKVDSKIVYDKKERTERMARRLERLAARYEDEDMASPTSITPIDYDGKRKVNSMFESLNGHLEANRIFFGGGESRKAATYVYSQNGKRIRTMSPMAARQELDSKRRERENKKQERRTKDEMARRRERDELFFCEMLQDVQDGQFVPVNDCHGSSLDRESFDAEAVRQAAIEESRRKIAELEADRPIWEAAAARRREEDLAEDRQRAARLAKAKQEEKERRRKEAEKLAREREENEEREREEREERERARKKDEQRKQQRQSWLYGKWSQQRAMERYLETSKIFDEAKFTNENPLTFNAIPWPILHSPWAFSIEDVSWQAVEAFFEAFRPKMRLQDFKALVEKSHRRFHPDRWKSRSLLTSVADEVERECLEVAANTVAQALTPLWQQVRATACE